MVDSLITGVMLNMFRPDFVRRAVDHYLALDLFSEFFVVNCNPSSKWSHPNERVRVLNLSHDVGLFARFMVAPFASNDCIFHSDEDVLWTHKTCIRMFNKWHLSPDNLHGTIGRCVDKSYNTKTVHGSLDIVLTTGGVLTSKETSILPLARKHLFSDIRSTPDGNGEDIILSYCGIENSGGMKNRAYKMPFDRVLKDKDNKEITGHDAIGKRCGNHRAHRMRIIKRCRSVFAKYL
jgi:hypothetical protein